MMLKICGLRRSEDIEYVNKYLPDYIGFIFAESKRKVSVEEVNLLKKELNSKIKTVGVFVNEKIENIIKIVEKTNLDIVQIHGDETPEYVMKIKERTGDSLKIWKAIRVKNDDSVSIMSEYNVDAFVLDAFVENSYGGVGKTFDWNIALKAKKYGKIFIAGGLNTANVGELIKKVEPYGVDVSSGIETNGFKDKVKISEFVKKVRKLG